MTGETNIVINTKVTDWAEKRLKAICARTGITLYNFLQMMCDTIIRYMSKDTNISPSMERAITLFEGIEGWDKQFNLCDCGEFHVEEAVYFIANEECHGMRAVMVKRPFFGKWTQTVNVQDIFEAIICKIFPGRYKKLRLLANEWGCKSQLDVLDRLLDKELQGVDTASIRQEFEDCERSDYGQKPTDHRYKRKHHKDIEKIEGLPKQQTIHFDPDDEPPVNPHGMVW